MTWQIGYSDGSAMHCIVEKKGEDENLLINLHPGCGCCSYQYGDATEEEQALLKQLQTLPEAFLALEEGYQALKDIVNASDGDEPYTQDELGTLFLGELDRMNGVLKQIGRSV